MFDLIDTLQDDPSATSFWSMGRVSKKSKAEPAGRCDEDSDSEGKKSFHGGRDRELSARVEEIGPAEQRPISHLT